MMPIDLQRLWTYNESHDFIFFANSQAACKSRITQKQAKCMRLQLFLISKDSQDLKHILLIRNVIQNNSNRPLLL